MNKIPLNTFLWILAMIVIILIINSDYSIFAQTKNKISYTEFKQFLSEREVSKVIITGQRLEVTLKNPIQPNPKQDPSDQVTLFMLPTDDPSFLPSLEAAHVQVFAEPENDTSLASWFFFLLPWILIGGFYWWMFSSMKNRMGGGIGSKSTQDFISGSGKKVHHDTPNVGFDDVAGQDNAKQEVAELVQFLRDPAKYHKVGAEAPRGVMLMGPPGTGKTLLARALAGEAGVPFFNISASEFIELYVGVGASRVRNMFEEAKKRAPCIIFIDEIDSVGRTRGTGLGGGHDEREQTLNQILAEMDGFEGHEAVIVLAATNRPDVLDPALLRPGRFDRHVTLELPDKAAREAILKVHTRKLQLTDNVDLAKIAAGTPGFSGADLKNLVNEAAIMVARERQTKIAMRNLDEMRDKIMMGGVRTLAIQPDEHQRLAVHESGHTAVAHYMPNADPLYKVTIIPRGRALGATHSLPEEERHTLDENYLRDRLAIMLGGRTAEQVFLGTVSSGADDDIKQATALARAMVGRWGMSEEIGPMDLRDSESHPFLGREIAQQRHYSETTAHQVDQAVSGLLKQAEKRAEEVINKNRKQVEKLIEQLQENETLDKSQIEACLGQSICRIHAVIPKVE